VLASVPDCQRIVKKAIAEKLKSYQTQGEWLEETGPEYKVEVSLLKDKAVITLDSSGAGLHKRGYRTGSRGSAAERNPCCSFDSIDKLDA
jgi:putative N6-adenine-specific DNA methylase